MRLTRQSEIAVAVLAACARKPSETVTTSVAAAEASASRVHTSKIVHMLIRSDLLVATRGRSGGLRLARPAASISLADVILHTQPELITPGERRTSRRPSDNLFSEIAASARQTFAVLLGRFTVADLVTGRAIERIACTGCHLLTGPRGATHAPPNRLQPEEAELHARVGG